MTAPRSAKSTYILSELYSTTTNLNRNRNLKLLLSPPSLPPPALPYLMICLGIDERLRVSILGMQDRLRTVDTLLGPLWPFGGTVLTRSKRTLFSNNTHCSMERSDRKAVGKSRWKIRQNQEKGRTREKKRRARLI